MYCTYQGPESSEIASRPAEVVSSHPPREFGSKQFDHHSGEAKLSGVELSYRAGDTTSIAYALYALVMSDMSPLTSALPVPV